MRDADRGASNDPIRGADLADIVRKVVDDNRYMVLGTADRAGRPWVSPVFYAAEAYRDFYWISSPESSIRATSPSARRSASSSSTREHR